MQLGGLDQTFFGVAFLMEKMYVNIYFLTLVTFHTLVIGSSPNKYKICLLKKKVCMVDLQKLPDHFSLVYLNLLIKSSHGFCRFGFFLS